MWRRSQSSKATTTNLGSGAAHSLRIRFFFYQHVDEHESQSIDVWAVNVKTLLTGERIDEDGDLVSEPVKLFSDRRAITVPSGQTYFDYNALLQIEEAKDAGYQSLTEIRLSIKPEFRIGRDETFKGRKQVFDIPLLAVSQ